MNEEQKRVFLTKAKLWFREIIIKNHVKNTKKLKSAKKFDINPFLVHYLANFLTGNSSAESIAKVLIYPRILASSISTSFGTGIQKFSLEALDSYGSAIPGIDIEFLDQVDGRKKYCQLKLGPQTINKDDVETIHNHFTSTLRLARTNSLDIGFNDLIVGVLYGSDSDLSGNYIRITEQYHHPVIVGQDFWHRLTGDSHFYQALIESFASVALEVDASEIIKETIVALANSEQIQAIADVTREEKD